MSTSAAVYSLSYSLASLARRSGIAAPLLFAAARDGRLPHTVEDGVIRFSRSTAIPLIERASVSAHGPDAA